MAYRRSLRHASWREYASNLCRRVAEAIAARTSRAWPATGGGSGWAIARGRSAAPVGVGDEAGTQAVRGIRAARQPGADQVVDRFRVQQVGKRAVATADLAQDRAVGDAGVLEPGVQGSNRAVRGAAGAVVVVWEGIRRT